MLAHRAIPRTFAALGFTALSACSFAEPTLQGTRQLDLQVSPDATFSIDAGAGSLELEGDEAADSIRVEAEIWQVEPSDDYTLSLEPDGEGGARLVAESDSSAGWRNRQRIDLSIAIPASMAVRINDGSGSIRVTGVAGDLDIEDGSGSIGLSAIGGSVSVDDGSGSFTAEEIGGDLDINDGSGSITINAAGGDVTIDDGSGSITVRNAAGVVTVDDGSGSITVDGAAEFELLDDGSGSVNLDNIRNRD